MTSPIENIETLIFDFDGTIADTLDLGIIISNNLADKYGYKKIRDKEDLAQYRNKSTQDALKAIGISYLKLPLVANSFRKRLAQRINELEPIPGIKETIQVLAKHYKLGIVTSNSSKNLDSFLKHHNLKDSFSFYSTGISLFKKHIVINNLIKKNKLSSGEILLIGDETRDIEAARTCGVAIASVTWGFHTEKILSVLSPDFIVHKPKELISLLKA